MAGGLLLVRVHVFALGFPAVLGGAAASTRWVQRHCLFALGAAALAAAAFVLVFYDVTGAVPALEYFVANVHTLQEPTAYTGWYRSLLQEHGKGVAVPAGMLAVFAAGLGAWIAAYAAALTLALRSRTLGAAGRVPIAMIACYILLMLTAPMAEHGDSTELTQRPFVLLYAVVAAWSAAVLAGWLVSRARLGERSAWLALLAASTFALLLVWPRTAALSAPKFAWGAQHLAHRVAPGLQQAARFLRRNLRPGEVFAVQGPALWSFEVDAATQLTALTGAPAYLARPYIHMKEDRSHEPVVLERYGALSRVAEARDIAAAMARLRDMGVRWYVVAASAGPQWDPERRRAAFVQGEVAVYASGPAGK
jgi:hypothetical protein